jgi:hypothetical protein
MHRCFDVICLSQTASYSQLVYAPGKCDKMIQQAEVKEPQCEARDALGGCASELVEFLCHI